MSATIKDIAKMTGLGLATISKYLNGGTVREQNRALIENAVAALHYRPNDIARSLKTNHTKTIGVIIPELNNAFITSIITIIEDILRQHNYATIVCDCRSDPQREAEAVSFLLQKRVDGLINMPTCSDGSHLGMALEADIPIVLVDRLVESLNSRVSAVIVDNEAAVERGAGYLMALGHQRIGLVLGEENLYTTRCRKSGYLLAHQKQGIGVEDQMIRDGGYTLSGGYQAMRSLMALRDRPSAVIVTNYEMTIGAMILLNEMDIKVPDDLSIIGFDKLDAIGGIFPHLSLITQPQNQIGVKTAQLMLSLINGKGSRKHQIITLSTQLLKRESAGMPRLPAHPAT